MRQPLCEFSSITDGDRIALFSYLTDMAAKFDRVAHDVRRARKLAQRPRFAPFGSEANGRKDHLEKP